MSPVVESGWLTSGDFREALNFLAQNSEEKHIKYCFGSMCIFPKF